MPEQPDLDLIRKVQQARMQHDSEARPSDVSANYWIEARYEAGPAPTARAGQWAVEIPAETMDAVWEHVKAATVRGDLGYKAKIATAARNKARTHTLVIRTYDSADAKDVARIRAALDALGFKGEWRYEHDHA